MDNFKRCKTCKYYKQFFILNNLHFIPFYGRCVHEERYKPHGSENLVEDCNLWEQSEYMPERIKHDVVQTIDEINERLYEISEVLNLYKD